MIDNKEKAIIMMCCGALNDIAEKSKEEYTPLQIKAVQMTLQKLIDYIDPTETIFNQ